MQKRATELLASLLKVAARRRVALADDKTLAKLSKLHKGKPRG